MMFNNRYLNVIENISIKCTNRNSVLGVSNWMRYMENIRISKRSRDK